MAQAYVGEEVESSRSSSRLRVWRTELHAILPLVLIALATIVTAEFVKYLAIGGVDESIFRRLYSFGRFWVMAIPALLPMLFFRQWLFERPASPTMALVRGVPRYFTADGRFVAGFCMILVVQPFIRAFAELKALITYVQPFSWDQTFERWDRILHFGYHPWEWLQPLLGYGPVSMLININYNFWFLTLTMYWLHFAFRETNYHLRLQAMLAYLLTWTVGGVGLAMYFSSAGPCYFGNLDLGHNPYAVLMTYLRQTNETWPLWALGLQDMLWMNYSMNYGEALTKGISAMPSMHNAQSVLLVLATWNKHRLIRNLAIAHGVLVFLGSIHLGWHYAVDAYLAFAIAGIAWIVAGYGASAWEKRRQVSLAVSYP
ncbi:MAG: phosphatase PAP2 family protein [Alphaproteobacteria bacterium]|nr:phosphatase PAP2 family protein [Alphaproteobacteria bacterium]